MDYDFSMEQKDSAVVPQGLFLEICFLVKVTFMSV